MIFTSGTDNFYGLARKSQKFSMFCFKKAAERVCLQKVPQGGKQSVREGTRCVFEGGGAGGNSGVSFLHRRGVGVVQKCIFRKAGVAISPPRFHSDDRSMLFPVHDTGEPGDDGREDHDQGDAERLAGDVLDHTLIDVRQLPAWDASLDEVAGQGHRR